MPNPDVACKHCGHKYCYEHCQNAADGKHVPDPGSIIPCNTDIPWTVDVKCRNCEVTGGYKINPEEIQWE